MKNFKLTTIPVLALLIAMVMNSCGTTNFKGYYPDNNITGKGMGYENTNTVAVTEETEDATVALDEAVANSTEEVVAVNEPVYNMTKGEKIEKIAMKLLEKRGLMANVPAINGKFADGRKLTLTQRLQSKMMNKIAKKRFENIAMSTADIFAIVSISSGGLAILTFYGAFLFGLVAIVFGALALARGTSRRGLAIGGIVMGAFALLLWLLLLGFVFSAGWFVA